MIQYQRYYYSINLAIKLNDKQSPKLVGNTRKYVLNMYVTYKTRRNEKLLNVKVSTINRKEHKGQNYSNFPAVYFWTSVKNGFHTV